jgi:hypothetical protein
VRKAALSISPASTGGSLLHAREAPHLFGELRDLAIEIRNTSALLVDDIGRRVGDKARVGQLGRGLVAILLRSLPALLEPAQLGRHVVDEPGERCQHGAPVDQRYGARRQRRLRAHDLDRFQVGHARDRSSERGNCVAIVRQVGPDICRRGPRMRHIELAANLPHAEHDGAQRLDLAAGLVVRGIPLGARVGLQHDAGTATARERADTLPDFLGDERHERVQQPQGCFEHLEQRAPRARFLRRRRGGALQHRFRELEVPVAELVPDEFVDRLRRKVEPIGGELRTHLARHESEARTYPAVLQWRTRAARRPARYRPRC